MFKSPKTKPQKKISRQSPTGLSSRPKASRSAVQAQNYPRSAKTTAKNPAKTVILIDILAAVLVVIFGLVYSFQNTPAKLAERELETLATDYYESYIYPSLLGTAQAGSADQSDSSSSDDVTDSSTSVSSSAPLTSFSTTLSDLLLWDNRAWQGKTRYLERYCDTSATTVEIIPESLAAASDFHLEATLSCEF